MAKVKSSGLRNYVGRLGGSVYYMLKGQNIAREKAPEVSNPRTATQMRQRMQWANLVAMYKCLQPYLGKKAFQNKPASWSDYNAFMSANLGTSTVYLTKEAVQNGVAYLAPYKVTEGSLPAISTAYNAETKIFETNISVGDEVSLLTTIGQLSELIISKNTGWQEGDQLGIIVMQNGRLYRPYVQAFEIILDRSDERTFEEFIPTSQTFITNSDDGTLSVNASALENPTQGLAYAVAVIHSRTISGKTSVSTQSLVLNTNAMNDYRAHITEDAFNAARESYGLPTEVWLDAGYQGEPAEPAAFALLSVSVNFLDPQSSESITRTATNGQPNFKVEQAYKNEDMAITFKTNKNLSEFSLNDFIIDFVSEGGTRYNVSESFAPTIILGDSVRLAGKNASIADFSNEAGRYYISVGDFTAFMAVTA